MKHKEKIEKANQEFEKWYIETMSTLLIIKLSPELECIIHEYMHMAYIKGCIIGIDTYGQVIDENLSSLNKRKWEI